MGGKGGEGRRNRRKTPFTHGVLSKQNPQKRNVLEPEPGSQLPQGLKNQVEPPAFSGGGRGTTLYMEFSTGAASTVSGFVEEGSSLPNTPQNHSRLTGLMDPRVVAELQHVEVPSLHAAPDVVEPRDVRALVVHLVQRPHEVVVAVVAKGHRGNKLGEEEEGQEG